MIVYDDSHYLIVNKPTGLFVHPSREARQIKENLLHTLKSVVGHKLHAVNRLDRATSGLIILAKTSQAASALSLQFRTRSVAKYYLAVVRGWSPKTGSIHRPLRDLESETGEKKEALTYFYTLTQVQLPQQEAKLSTTRYSLLLLKPVTGRQHQLRRHLKSLQHPIIGDTRYGKGDQNRWFRDQLGISRLLLHSFALSFDHPFQQRPLSIEQEPEDCLLQIFPDTASEILRAAKNAISDTTWQCQPQIMQIDKNS